MAQSGQRNNPLKATLLGITDQIPQRANDIRILTMELNRIGSHMIALGTGVGLIMKCE